MNRLAEEIAAATVPEGSVRVFVDCTGIAAPGEYDLPASVYLPLDEDVETEAQWREWQLARQAADQKARTAERENLNRALYRFLLGNQAAAVKN